MSTKVFLIIICGALLHAIWNAMVKKEKDKYLSITAVVLGHIPIAVIIILLTPTPSIQSLPYIFISAIFLTGYEWCLLSAYRLDDYTKVYPVARGSAPIFIVMLAWFIFDLKISKFELLGILIISAGIITLCFQNLIKIKNNSAILYALGTGMFISLYSTSDGYGGKISASPLSYTAWLLILNALIFMILLKVINKSDVIKKVFIEGKKVFFVGGTFSYTAYAVVVWAFTHVSFPVVAAVRETNIVFSILLGSLFLKERFTLLRVASILIIFFGVVLIKFY